MFAILDVLQDYAKGGGSAKPIRIESQFPSPYDESGNAIVTLDDETVKMPLWYWLKICDYVIDVETNIELQKNQ